jgi:hypothetical protein
LTGLLLVEDKRVIAAALLRSGISKAGLPARALPDGPAFLLEASP